jgi:methionyl-tRNA formyltransferase
VNNGTPLNVLFFGTAEFAVPSLLALQESHHNIVSVVTQPDKPSGRGNKVAYSPVKVAALALELPVMQPKRVRSPKFIERVRQMNPDAIALAAFGQIIPAELLEIPRLGPINVHGSLLPAYRGAAPIQWSILNGDDHTGVATMWMEPTLDTGEVLLSSAMPIEDTDNTLTLTHKLAAVGADLLVTTLDNLADGTAVRRPQDNTLATYAPPIQPNDGVIKWNETARQIDCRVRAMYPKPGATASIKDRKVKVWMTLPAPGIADEQAVGTILALTKDMHTVLVAAGNGTAIHLIEVQPENGRRMPADAWARGLRLQPGDQFS